MAGRRHPTIRRDETIRSVLIGLVVLALAAATLLSDRPLGIGDRPAMMVGAEIPRGTWPGDFIRSLDAYGVHIVKRRHRPLFGPVAPVIGASDNRADPVTLRFGYSIVETDVLGMPFIPRRDFGHVIYMETPDEFVVVPISDEYLKLNHFPAEAPLSVFALRWWWHIWGWLFVLAAIGIGLFELGALRRRREALGLI